MFGILLHFRTRLSYLYSFFNWGTPPPFLPCHRKPKVANCETGTIYILACHRLDGDPQLTHTQDSQQLAASNPRIVYQGHRLDGDHQ